ncbi:retrovirus-related pol polyprotein from transposon TNT 1-94 [Tanacetum coccineum]
MGLPSLTSLKTKIVSACAKGSITEASFKTKRHFPQQSLHLLHMDLFGHVKPQTISHNKYTLIIVDEYSRLDPSILPPEKEYAADCTMDHLGKFDEKVDDGFFLGYSTVAKAFRVFNIRRQEMEEIVHVTFSEDDEAISQSSTEGDGINFNENRTFPDDEFLEPKNPPEFTDADDHPALSDHNQLESADHLESTDNLDSAECQDIVLSEPISDLTLLVNHLLVSPQEVGSETRKLHQLYVNFLFEMEPKKLTEALEEEGWIIAMQEELTQFEKNKGYNQQEWIDYEETFAPVARLEALRKSFLLYAAYMVYMGFDLKAYSDSDYAECNLDRKSTSGGCQILDRKLIKSQLADYDVLYDTVPIFCDNTSAIAISNNPVLHSRTKHIDNRVILPKKAVAETQHAKVTVATADDTRSLVASELAQDQGNQPLAADAEKERVVKLRLPPDPYKESELALISKICTLLSATQGAANDDPSPYYKLIIKRVLKSETLRGLDNHTHLLMGQANGTETLHAFADKPAQSDPLGHLYEEPCLLNNVRNICGLLKDALKDTLPQLIKDSIKHFVSASIAEELPQVEAQVQKKLQDQLPNILLKPMYKEFNTFNKLESRIFNNLQEQLSKGIKTSLDKSISLNDLKPMFKDMFSFLEAAEVFKKANAGAQVIPNAQQAPPVHKEKALVLHTSEEKISGEKNTDDEPPLKKLKFLIPTSSEIPSPTPLNSIMPELQKPDANKMTMDQFTEHLTNTTSSIFSPSPPREPTPPRDEQKGKGIATEDPIKDIMPFMEEGGSAPKIPSFKSFVIPEGQRMSWLSLRR